MVFRRTGEEGRGQVQEEQTDGLNIISDEDDEDEEVVGGEETLFEPGEQCWVCEAEPGTVGIDPTCHGTYAGDGPVLVGAKCLEQALKNAYGKDEGIAIIVEPFGENDMHLYYRLDEMPAYQFPREDVEAISWLLLTIGDDCARCGQQSHFAWLTPQFVDPELPEEPNRAVFRNMDRDIEHLCRACTAAQLAKSYTALDLDLITVEVPRSAMGIMMPSGA
ncbi:MAG: hypothetical protein M3P30_11985 [Chloroflexota bacterium]|nr:hypothetical protein [Chloroflexota bacterium]